MNNTTITAGITSIFLLIPLPATATPIEQHLKQVISHLVGAMDRTAQVAADPEAVNVEMTTCKVNLPQAEDIFLYQEQALTRSFNQPYRQRFLRLRPSIDGHAVESRAYKPENPDLWIGLCNRPPSQRTLQLADLGEGVCSVFLTPVQEGYRGVTHAGGCPTKVRGATRITNTILLHSTGMDTWDRGYDSNWQQVWGADAEPYQFRWQSPQSTDTMRN
jgi:hypothetical protein